MRWLTRKYLQERFEEHNLKVSCLYPEVHDRLKKQTFPAPLYELHHTQPPAHLEQQQPMNKQQQNHPNKDDEKRFLFNNSFTHLLAWSQLENIFLLTYRRGRG